MPPITCQIPVLIKASTGPRGERLISLEASNELVDAESDCIAQEALLKAAPGFIKSGFLDQDHLAEIGERLGVQSPSSYICGVPLSVEDLGERRTGVVGMLHQNRPVADAVWQQITANPPAVWRASVFAYPEPAGLIDVRRQPDHPARTRFPTAGRYIVLSLASWSSLALTQHPINTAIRYPARPVAADPAMRRAA